MAVQPEKILSEAASTLTQRGHDYDQKGGERAMALTVEIYNAIRGGKMTEQDGWYFMLALKLARAQRGKPKMDTYVDLSAYAALAGECALASLSEKNDG